MGAQLEMSIRPYWFGYRKLALFERAAVRMGACVGICLSIVFFAWIMLANRVPSLEPFAMERNVAAEAVLGFLALLPVVRFLRRPGQLLVSGLIGWAILSFTYWVMGLHFVGLAERWSTFEIFTKGGIGYLIASTSAWVGTCVWRVKALQTPRVRPNLPPSHVAHSNHHTS